MASISGISVVSPTTTSLRFALTGTSTNFPTTGVTDALMPGVTTASAYFTSFNPAAPAGATYTYTRSSATSSTITVSGLTVGQSYSYTIAVRDGGGSTLTRPGSNAKPGIPFINNIVGSSGNGTVKFTYTNSRLPIATIAPRTTTPPTGAQISAFPTDYVFCSGPASPPVGSTYSYDCLDGQTGTFIISGLNNNAAYMFTLTYKNQYGSTAIIYSNTPGVPFLNSISPTSTTLPLTWVYDTPGTIFRIYNNNAFVADASGSSYRITGLSTGSAYSVQITAMNGLVESNRTTARSGTIPAFPSAPTNLSVTGGDKILSVAFTIATGAVATYQYSLDNGSTWTTRASGSTASPLLITTLADGITPLTNGTAYSVQLRATAVPDIGPASNTVSVTPIPPPGAPTIISITPSTGKLAVNYTSGATNGNTIGALQYSLNNGTSWTSVGISSPINITTGLTNGTPYDVRIRAVGNVSSPGTQSNAVSATPSLTPPGVPIISSITPSTNNLAVYFTAGTGTNTTYQYSLDQGATWTTRESGTTESPLSITGLTNNTAYSVRIRALNVDITSPGTQSNAVSATPSLTPIETPTISYALSRPDGAQMEVGWSPIVFPGETTTYTVKYRDTSLAPTVFTTTNTTLPTTGISVTSGKTYAISVRANITNMGSSVYSDEVLRTPSTNSAASPVINSFVVNSVSGDNTNVTVIIASSNYSSMLISTGANAVLVPTVVTSLGNNLYSYTYTSTLGPGVVNFYVRSADFVTHRYTYTAYRRGTVAQPPTAVTATAGVGIATVSWTPPTNLGRLSNNVTAATLSSYTIKASPGGATTTITAAAATTSGNTATIYGLSANTTYTFAITTNTSVDGDNNYSSGRVVSSLADSSATCTIATAPSPLTSVPSITSLMRGFAGGAFGHINLKWSSVTEAVATTTPTYTVRSYTASNNALVGTDGTNTTPTFYKWPLSINTSYYFTVMASWTSITGHTHTTLSSNSNTVLIPDSAPATPAIMSIVGNGGTSKTVSWTWPGSQSTITGWQVSPTGSISAFETISTLPDFTTFTDISNNTTYSYTYTAAAAAAVDIRVRAINGDIFGNDYRRNGNISVITPTGVSNGNVTLSWTTTDWQLYTPSLINYTVTASPGGASVTTPTNTTTTATVTGLTNGTAYTFTVRANGASGTSVTSSPSAAVTPSTIPDAPTGVSATARNVSAVVSWTAPANGGSAITSYTVTSSPGGITETTSDGSTTQITVPGLTNGTGYTFTVVATNAVGNGPASSASGSITPRATPDAPTGVSATAGNGSAVVSWTAPDNNGVSVITSYTVTSSPGDITATTSDGSTTQITVPVLTNGIGYTFTVVATNAAGNGPASSASGSVTPKGTLTSATYQDSIYEAGTLKLRYTLAADTALPTSSAAYTVTRIGGEVVSGEFISPNIISVYGLAEYTLYKFTIGCDSVFSNTVNTSAGDGHRTLDITAPGVVANSSCDVSSSQLTLIWSDVSVLGGSAITYYVFSSSSETVIGNALPSSAKAAGSGLYSQVITGLNNRTAYSYYVRAIDADGNIGTPVTISGTPLGPVLSTPTPSEGSKTDTSITISGYSVANADRYTGKLYSNIGKTTQVGLAVTATDANGITFSGLSGNTTYYATVTAERVGDVAYENSVASSAVQVTTNKSTLASPASPSVSDITTTSITVGWSPVSGTGVTYSVAMYDNSGRTGSPVVQDTSVSGTTKTFTGLSAATPYYFNIVAQGSNYISSTAAQTSGTTAAVPTSGSTDTEISSYASSIITTAPATVVTLLNTIDSTKLRDSIAGIITNKGASSAISHLAPLIGGSTSSTVLSQIGGSSISNTLTAANFSSKTTTATRYAALKSALTEIQTETVNTTVISGAVASMFAATVDTTATAVSVLAAARAVPALKSAYYSSLASNGVTSLSVSDASVLSDFKSTFTVGTNMSSAFASASSINVIVPSSSTITLSGTTEGVPNYLAIKPGEAYTLTIGSESATVSYSGTTLSINSNTVTLGAKFVLGGRELSIDAIGTVAVTDIGAAGAPTVPCFFGNARVKTQNGYRRMDSLKEGDLVLTPAGSSVAIERVKKYAVAAGPSTNPYVIPAGLYGAERRVIISPDHKVCLPDGRKVEAKKLGLVQEERDGMLTYYNLELTGEADMVVSGVAVESLVHVTRVVISMDQFVALMAKKYGAAAISPAMMANVKRTCRMLADGRVEVPVHRR
jgi:hypothetical protein